MNLSRRTLLLAPLLAAAAPVARARLRPGTASAIGFTPLPQDRVAFRAGDVEGEVVLPVARARLLAVLPLGDRDLAALAFAADPPGGRLDMLAVVGCDASAMRILALDILSWQADDGGHLKTRLAASGLSLVLQRDAAAPRGRLLWRRESWTDYLAATGDGALNDRPTRPPLPDTWQSRHGIWRRRVAAVLAHGGGQIAGPLEALCQPPDLDAP